MSRREVQEATTSGHRAEDGRKKVRKRGGGKRFLSTILGMEREYEGNETVLAKFHYNVLCFIHRAFTSFLLPPAPLSSTPSTCNSLLLRTCPANTQLHLYIPRSSTRRQSSEVSSSALKGWIGRCFEARCWCRTKGSLCQSR
jgi:hypothetical protein